jgi:para-aminobenzoate synthetase component 1
MFHLNRGDSYLLNLTMPVGFDTNMGLKEIFRRSQAPYKLWMKDKFTVFSPEPFVKINDNRIFSHPMKGTIDADLPDAEQKLLADPKELAEHYTIVDLIRNDLNMVSKKVKVDQFRYVEKIQTNRRNLLQTSSLISGELPVGFESRIGTIITSLLPAGSISGAPKKKTVEVILETELYDRGYYTGVFGVFDGKQLDSAVMIRFIEQTETGMVFKAGGGITVNSKVEDEYQELLDKVYLPFL